MPPVTATRLRGTTLLQCKCGQPIFTMHQADAVLRKEFSDPTHGMPGGAFHLEMFNGSMGGFCNKPKVQGRCPRNGCKARVTIVYSLTWTEFYYNLFDVIPLAEVPEEYHTEAIASQQNPDAVCGYVLNVEGQKPGYVSVVEVLTPDTHIVPTPDRKISYKAPVFLTHVGKLRINSKEKNNLAEALRMARAFDVPEDQLPVINLHAPNEQIQEYAELVESVIHQHRVKYNLRIAD